MSEYECVFVKYRNLIKFEQFETNHPAVYVPFVIYNWLALALLPNLYSDDEFFVEISRKELLQDNEYLVKVINVVINCVLGIEIELDYELFKQNIQKLKQVKNITRDQLLPYVTVENYMSEEDSVLFIESISKFFPKNSIKKTSDAVPCYNFYKTLKNISGVTIWGAGFWVVLHYTALVVDLMSPSKLKESYQESLCILPGILDLLLPCDMCRQHYSSFYKMNEEEDFERPFQLTLPIYSLSYAKNNNLFDFYSLVHDHCKPLDPQRERLSPEHYKTQYIKFYKLKNVEP